ncbi:MAG TPA: hypothetical protein VE988_02405, partial [Gemmataceae bacterium]|nr:hypothetical protein [Gemmataceae bacterium]
MKRSFATLSALTAAVLCVASIEPANGHQNQQWGTIKGQVVWGGQQIPQPQLIQPPPGVQVLAKNPRFKGGVLPDDALVVNAKNKGIKNVFVYFLVLPGQKIAIHPNLQAVPKAPVIIDATNGTFEPRCVVQREGQALFVNNNGNVEFYPNVQGDPAFNVGGVITL